MRPERSAGRLSFRRRRFAHYVASPDILVDSQLVFVYGTLKRGLANHKLLLTARFEGEAMMEGIRLYDLGPYPMAIHRPGLVHGEVYRVDAPVLANLDRLEGVPRLYRREQRALADGRQAWVYLGNEHQVRNVRDLPGGRWPA